MRFLRRLASAAAVIAAATLAAGVARPHAQATTPVTAGALLDAAKPTALAGQKNILVEFGASWCGWCRRFEDFVQSPEVGALVGEHFVIVRFVVRESPDKRAVNTLGAPDLMDEWGGARAGLPFYVFLNARGEKIANSNAMPTGANIGYPATSAEVAAFMKLLEQAAPRMSPDDRARIAEFLKRR